MNPSTFRFSVENNQGQARAGRLFTPHGEILTPIFAPVGTQATVKAVTPAQLDEIGAQLILGNTYHLYLRPGDHLIAEFNGIHEFMHWDKPVLTDSGGFQVFSLSANRSMDDDGATFKSHIDGSMHRLTPEKSIAIQENLGADIIMAFDECAPPYDRTYNEIALARTHAWAERCLAVKKRSDQALFGIVQGGVFPDLREKSAKYLTSLGFPGYAIGGLSVGETKAEMLSMLSIVTPLLPENKPRYLMGVGTPKDLLEGIARGIDIFDCVLPTRLARHHAAMLRNGQRLNMINATFSQDHKPIDTDCGCYTCQNFSRAYLRHLIVAKEMLAATLLSIHNLYALISFSQEIRIAIIKNKFDQLYSDFFTTFERINSPEDDLLHNLDLLPHSYQD